VNGQPSSVEQRPPLCLFMLEGQRALLELASLLPAAPWLGLAPRGDGHPVLVLPGFTASDVSTVALRRYLRRLGYHVHGWRLGRNLGFRGELWAIERSLTQRIENLYHRHGCKLSLVGWSLGGIYAREIARAMPARIRQVITLGSPFASRGYGSNVRGLYELVTGRRVADHDPEMMARLEDPPPVPATAILSRTDGVAHWKGCRERPAFHTDNIEVHGSHCGLGFNPAVFFAIADRLAQDEDGWRPFVRGGWRSLFYA
jgi:pimeloyl-ACP methyl ester carboxylesterase